MTKFYFLRLDEHVGQHFDQHQLTNMLVRFAFGTSMLAKKKMKTKCWPAFFKKLRNDGQQICKDDVISYSISFLYLNKK